ncbi:MAG: glutamate formimidoyltransferase [Vicinamibacterales bacterium]
MVPNVSEGRRATVIDELASVLRGTAGVTVLDVTSDPSHNRSVFTLVGSSEALLDATLRLFDIAIRHIDLRSHVGAHPRIGAVDVVPYIPLDGSTMDECVELAHEAGRAVAARYGVPIYFYERAALRPARTKLEAVRRGQFEGLPARMHDPEWAPDAGPAVPHPTAGATAVGARVPLIAFNVDLEDATLEDAKRIAATVRESSGGLPSVKALGLWLPHRNRAQVSMNLTDYTQTPVVAAFDAVARTAAARGVRVHESELIGLIPAGALANITPERIGLRDFDGSRVLEARIADAMRGAGAKASGPDAR